ncbi:hypothetical protein [Pelagibius sp.]|uniref:hypothetical protein n=1 Tax=Pelagibius sp. TaxID=1931238 RepID=UPI00260DCA13|nr:hypothetical protein [Pelagibius sp.]
MRSLPDVITHNYDPARGALQNLCDLPADQAEAILAAIRASGRLRIKADYLERRLGTEDWLLRERTRKLGRPHLKHPIYFFLGDFADGLDPSRPESLMIPLAVLPPEILTFTYPDSMASLSLAIEEAHLSERKSYHGQVFTLREIEDVIAQFGMPAPQGDHAIPKVRDRFIEVQIWDDRPLRRFLARR